MKIYLMTTIGEKLDLYIQPYALLTCKPDVSRQISSLS